MLNAKRGRIASVAAILAGLPLWAAEGQITKAVLGTGSTEDFEVVNPSTVFQPETAKIVCVWTAEGVKPGLHVRGVWFAEDTGGAAPPNYKIDEATVIAATSKAQFEGSGTFSFSRPTKGWPAGRYRVEIYLGDKLARTVRFSVAGKLAAVPAPRIIEAELGTGRTPERRLVNPGTVFPAKTARIVCAWKSAGIAPGVRIRAVWIAEDTGGAEPRNFEVGQASEVADASFDRGERTGSFFVEQPPKGWSPGRYRVEIYLDKELAKTVAFQIQGEAAPAASGPRITKAVLGTGRTDDWQIVNPASEFPADTPRIVCLWKAEGVPPGTTIREVWIAEDTGPSHPPNRKIAEGKPVEFTRGAFSLKSPSNGFRAGRYRLEIYLGEDLARTIPFTIKRAD